MENYSMLSRALNSPTPLVYDSKFARVHNKIKISNYQHANLTYNSPYLNIISVILLESEIRASSTNLHLSTFFPDGIWTGAKGSHPLPVHSVLQQRFWHQVDSLEGNLSSCSLSDERTVCEWADGFKQGYGWMDG